jgi:hypothetical protein
MNLYFQAFTHNVSASAIDIIKMSLVLRPKLIKSVRGRVASGGIVSSCAFSTIEELKARVVPMRLNEIEIEFGIDSKNADLPGGEIRRIGGVFRPSALNELWFPAKDFVTKDRNTGFRQMNASKEERYLKALGISRKPSVFEWFINATSEAASADDVLDWCSEQLIREALPRLEQLEVFGCCDVGGDEMIARLESEMLGLDRIRVMARVLPTSYPELGEKFDRLHSLLFGKRDVCEAILHAVGEGAKEYADQRNNFAVVRISSLVDLEKTGEKLSDLWLQTLPKEI